MTPDRWQLRRWGKAAYAFGIVCFVGAALLERAHDLARQQAEGSMQWHELQEHDHKDETEE